MDCLLFNHSWNSNTDHYTVIYLKNVDFTWRWFLWKPARNRFLSTWQKQFEMENLSSEISWNLTFSLSSWILVWWCLQGWRWHHQLPILCCVRLLLHNSAIYEKPSPALLKWGRGDAAADALKMRFEASWKFCKRLLCSNNSIDKVNESFVCARAAGWDPKSHAFKIILPLLDITKDIFPWKQDLLFLMNSF